MLGWLLALALIRLHVCFGESDCHDWVSRGNVTLASSGRADCSGSKPVQLGLGLCFQVRDCDRVPVDWGHWQSRLALGAVYISWEAVILAVTLIPICKHRSFNKALHQPIYFADTLPFLEEQVGRNPENSIQISAALGCHRSLMGLDIAAPFVYYAGSQDMLYHSPGE